MKKVRDRMILPQTYYRAFSITFVPFGLALFIFMLACGWTSAQSTPTEAALVSGSPAPLNLVRWSGSLPEAAGRTVDICFGLYEQPTGGSALWTETQSVKVGTDGRYTVLLGATNAEGMPQELFDAGEARWITAQLLDGQQVTDDAAAASAGLADAGSQPVRSPLATVPYAFNALNAETLDGHAVADFVTREDLNSTVADQVQAISNTKVAVPSLGTATPSYIGNDGSGTTGQIPLWTSPNTLGDSLISQVGANVGIGTSTTSPATTLDVNGTASVQGNVRVVFGNDPTVYSSLGATSWAAMLIQPSLPGRGELQLAPQTNSNGTYVSDGIRGEMTWLMKNPKLPDGLNNPEWVALYGCETAYCATDDSAHGAPNFSGGAWYMQSNKGAMGVVHPIWFDPMGGATSVKFNTDGTTWFRSSMTVSEQFYNSQIYMGSSPTSFVGRLLDGGSFITLDTYNGTTATGKNLRLWGNTVSIDSGASATPNLVANADGSVSIPASTSPTNALTIGPTSIPALLLSGNEAGGHLIRTRELFGQYDIKDDTAGSDLLNVSLNGANSPHGINVGSVASMNMDGSIQGLKYCFAGSSTLCWLYGTSAPTGACSTGAIYSNTNDSAGSTLYTCMAGAWVPSGTGGTASGPAGGDLSGTFPNPIVTKINGSELKTDCLAPSASYPCVIGEISPQLYSGTTLTDLVTLATPVTAGQFRLCGSLTVTVPATASSVAEILKIYTGDGHFNAGPLSGQQSQGISLDATTQWAASGGCEIFYADALLPIQIRMYLVGVTGAPTFRYGATLERLQ